jgi:tRNA(Arg) A34 adenosine deaminase TadA
MATAIDEHFMRLAIAKALEGVCAGQSPYGAAVVRDGELLSCEHNVVLQTLDVAAHAEVNALRVAAARLGTVDLRGCVLYSTCEPCTMCFGACNWAHVAKIVFGASIADSDTLGFREVRITNETLRRLGGSQVELVGDVLREECLAIFTAWKAAGRDELY